VTASRVPKPDTCIAHRLRLAGCLVFLAVTLAAPAGVPPEIEKVFPWPDRLDNVLTSYTVRHERNRSAHEVLSGNTDPCGWEGECASVVSGERAAWLLMSREGTAVLVCHFEEGLTEFYQAGQPCVLRKVAVDASRPPSAFAQDSLWFVSCYPYSFLTVGRHLRQSRSWSVTDTPSARTWTADMDCTPYSDDVSGCTRYHLTLSGRGLERVTTVHDMLSSDSQVLASMTPADIEVLRSGGENEPPLEYTETVAGMAPGQWLARSRVSVTGRRVITPDEFSLIVAGWTKPLRRLPDGPSRCADLAPPSDSADSAKPSETDSRGDSRPSCLRVCSATTPMVDWRSGISPRCGRCRPCRGCCAP
jgi:hypothetical protein